MLLTHRGCCWLLLLLLFCRSVVSNSLQPNGLQHARLLCPSPSPGVYSNSCLLSRWCHPTISSSVVPFSSCLQSFPASGSFLMSQFFASSGQSIGTSASASVLPMSIQGWFPLGLTGLSKASGFSMAESGILTVSSLAFLFNVSFFFLFLADFSTYLYYVLYNKLGK